jgi:hypothetical protein
MFLLKSLMLEWVNKILVSSAKIIGADSINIGGSGSEWLTY